MLTPFGKMVRKARIDTNTTLTDLARHLDVSVPFLSSVENGRKRIPESWNEKIKSFFNGHGLSIDFSKAILMSSKTINVDSLPTKTADVLTRLSAVDLDGTSEENYKRLVEALSVIEKETNL